MYHSLVKKLRPRDGPVTEPAVDPPQRVKPRSDHIFVNCTCPDCKSKSSDFDTLIGEAGTDFATLFEQRMRHKRPKTHAAINATLNGLR